MKKYDIGNTPLARAAKNVLVCQYKAGKGSSRADHKAAHGGKTADYSRITADTSLVQHMKMIKGFCQYANETYGIRAWKDVTPEHFSEYLQIRSDTGISHDTLQAHVTAYNHVMVGKGLMTFTEADRSRLSSYVGKNHQGNTNRVYKDKTSEEWRSAHPEDYKRAASAVDTARAFGLREDGLFGSGSAHGKASGKYGVTDRTIFRDGSGCLYISTVEKAGQWRLAPCRADLQGKMESLYGQYARPMGEAPRSRAGHESMARHGIRLLLHPNKTIPLHIHRAEYAQGLFREVQAKLEKEYGGEQGRFHGYTTVGRPARGGVTMKAAIAEKMVTQIGTYKGYVEAFLKVSEAMGHHRLDVLLKYLR